MLAACTCTPPTHALCHTICRVVGTTNGCPRRNLLVPVTASVLITKGKLSASCATVAAFVIMVFRGTGAKIAEGPPGVNMAFKKASAITAEALDYASMEMSSVGVLLVKCHTK